MMFRMRIRCHYSRKERYAETAADNSKRSSCRNQPWRSNTVSLAKKNLEDFRGNRILPYDDSAMKTLDILNTASFVNHELQALHVHVRNVKHASEVLHRTNLVLQYRC